MEFMELKIAQEQEADMNDDLDYDDDPDLCNADHIDYVWTQVTYIVAFYIFAQ